MQFENYLLMPLKLGKMTLIDYMSQRRKNKQPFTDFETSKIMGGTFAGINYMYHEKNIIHRDLKQGNVVIRNKKDLSKIKIIDFGFATENTESCKHYFKRLGAHIYQSPEQTNNYFTILLLMENLLIFGLVEL